MKKLFNRAKRPERDWDGYDEGEYDWDDVGGYEEDTPYFEEEGDGAYYAGPETGEGADQYYTGADEDTSYYAGGEMEIDGESELYEAVGAEWEADGYAGQDNGYDAEGRLEDRAEEYDEDGLEDWGAYDTDEFDLDASDGEEDAGEVLDRPTGRARGGKTGLAGRFHRMLAGMSALDRIIAGTGAAVLVLAVITVSVFVSSKIVDNQISGFVSVGDQLDGIDTIGGAGLLAVADAQMAKMAAASVLDDEWDEGYDEQEYEREVKVAMEFTSIQRDLKIKFVNERTAKLVANVPFAVTVTSPDGKTSIWSDDDMDGIIYKKDITPGDYKVEMEALTDAKYADYIVSTAAESVTVRKDIEYKKVNVANEIKSESEVDAGKEDTKKNETEVESVLQDTVAWVESKVTGGNPTEIAKSSITDPKKLLALSQTFLRATANSSEPSASPGPSEDPEPSPSESPSPSPSDEPTPTPTQTPTPTPEPTPTPTPIPKELSVKMEPPGTLNVLVGATITSQATVTFDGTSVSGVTYDINQKSTEFADASVDGNGKVTVTGKAAGSTSFTITVKKDGYVTGTATLNVTVNAKKNIGMSLDKTSGTVFMGEPLTINVTLTNVADNDPKVTATSSDANVAAVSVNKRAVEIKGVKAGTSTITVRYKEDGSDEVVATCAVTVKDHPKNDTVTKLKDTSGHQVYVLKNGEYKEATYADYYTADKFYLLTEKSYTGWQTIDGKVYFFTADGKKVTGEQVIQGAKYNFASDGSLVTGSGTLGIDVSKWNGTIDWNAVKNSGINYVIIRCGYRGSSNGSLIADPKFTANIKGATTAGLKVGVYFFTQAMDEREAVEEASMVLEQIKNYKISYPVFLDVESSGGRADSIDKATRTAVCKAFCQTIQNAGYNAGIYANKNWLETKLDPGALGSYKIWLAQYASAPTYKGRYNMWQYRSTGSVTGISGNVDMNLSYLGY